MASPELELQGAIVNRLKNDGTVTALIGTRVYDPVPASGATFPYVSFGPRDALSDDADCITGFEISYQLDVWSRANPAEAMRIADAVRASIHNYDFSLSTNGFVLFEHRITRTFRDPDGITTHAALTFEGFVQRL